MTWTPEQVAALQATYDAINEGAVEMGAALNRFAAQTNAHLAMLEIQKVATSRDDAIARLDASPEYLRWVEIRNIDPPDDAPTDAT